MRWKARFARTIPLVFIGTSLLLAEGMEPPKPGPEHARLERWVGVWKGSGEMKENPFGPAGKMTWTETCEWFPGNFHVICHSESKGDTGDSKGLSLIGYDAESKRYTWYGLDSSGWSDMAKGNVEAKTWTFSSETQLGGKPMKSRMVIEEVSPTANRFKWEMSEDGKNWTLLMDGESSK